jgi:hypothetical protein
MREKVFKQFFGGETDEKLVEELVGKLEGKLDGYEVILGKQKYLAGDVRASSCSMRAPLNRDADGRGSSAESYRRRFIPSPIW